MLEMCLLLSITSVIIAYLAWYFYTVIFSLRISILTVHAHTHTLFSNHDQLPYYPEQYFIFCVWLASIRVHWNILHQLTVQDIVYMLPNVHNANCKLGLYTAHRVYCNLFIRQYIYMHTRWCSYMEDPHAVIYPSLFYLNRN